MELIMWSLCKSIIYPVEANLKKTSARECVLPPSFSICLDSHLYSLFCFVLLTSSLTPAPHQETYWFLIYSGNSVNTHSPKIFTAFTSSNSRYACWGQVQASLPSCRQRLLMRAIPQTSLNVKKKNHTKAKCFLSLGKGLFKSHHETLPYIEAFIPYKYIHLPVCFATP